MTVGRRWELSMARDVSGDRIVAYVTSRLGSYYPELSGCRLSLSQGRSRTYRWSNHIEFAVLADGSTTGYGILVKVPQARDRSGRRQTGTRLDSAEKSGKREYEALKMLYHHLADGEMEGVTAVQPLDFLPEFAAIVMEQLPGHNLLEIVNAAVTLRQESQAIQAAYKAGCLLKALHEIDHGTYPCREVLDKEDYVAKMSSFVDTLQRLGLSEPCLRHLQDTVSIIQKELGQAHEGITLTFVHGDFYPENIVISEQGAVYTVDTTLHQVAPTLEDVAKLLVGLDTMKRAILFGKGLLKLGAIEEMKRAFLHGYFGHDLPCPRALTWCQIIALLRRWYEIYAAAQQFRPAWLRSVVRRFRIDPFMDARLSSLLAML